MAHDDVAIVGVACRFPGEAKSPEAFAEMLLEGRDAWSKVPSSRYNIDAFHHPWRDRSANMVRPASAATTDSRLLLGGP